MLQINRISKRFSHKTVLSDVTFNLSDGEHVGLVGSNGSGKTTLLQIIAGKLEPDSGSIITSSGDFIGYLAQSPTTLQAETIADAMLLGVNLANPYPRQELSARDEAEARKNLAHLGLGYLSLSTTLSTLSGGEGTRIQLAALLLQQPEILILDEPTNHLDIPALEWLEELLNSYPGIVLLVSHDRIFLDRTVQTIYELDEGKEGIRKFPGNYSNYAELVAQEKQKAYELWKDQEAEVKRLRGDWLATAEQARATEKSTRDSKTRRYAKKVAKKGTAKKKRLERYLDSSERIEKPLDTWRININFAEPEHQSQQLLTVDNISFGYANTPLFEDLNLTITAGQRETYHFLHYFLLDEDHAVLPTSALSFGQRARLLLARLVAQGANFLVLDEPVNHLDIPSREQFEKALEAFSGGMLLVAHDRAFIARTCNTLWELKESHVRVDVPSANWM